MCVVDPACHSILNWPLQMRTCNYIERAQAPAPPTLPATINRPAQLHAQLPIAMPLRCRLCSPGCRGGACGKRGGWPGRLYGLNRVSRSGQTGLAMARPGFVRGVPAGGILAAVLPSDSGGSAAPCFSCSNRVSRYGMPRTDISKIRQ